MHLYDWIILVCISEIFGKIMSSDDNGHFVWVSAVGLG